MGKWRNAPKGVFWFFHNYERLATVFYPPHPAGPLPLWGENWFCDESKDSPLGGSTVEDREGGHKKTVPTHRDGFFLGERNFIVIVRIMRRETIGYPVQQLHIYKHTPGHNLLYRNMVEAQLAQPTPEIPKK